MRRTSLIVIGWLLVQFLLGMATNLFVDITRDHPGANPAEYFSGVGQSVAWAISSGPLLLQLHATLGLILVAGSVFAFVEAMRAGSRGPRIATAVGGLSILGAGFNGGSFLNYDEDFSSMIMAALFAIALGAYAAAMYLAREPA